MKDNVWRKQAHNHILDILNILETMQLIKYETFIAAWNMSWNKYSTIE
jgi:hypothetical protein